MNNALQLPRRSMLTFMGKRTELHCLKECGPVARLWFLKNHFLRASVNKFGQLHMNWVSQMRRNWYHTSQICLKTNIVWQECCSPCCLICVANLSRKNDVTCKNDIL